VAVVGQLGGHEHVAALQAALADGLANAVLVGVGGCCVDGPVAGPQGMADSFGGLLGRHLEHAEPKLGHTISVIQVHVGDRCGLCGHSERLSTGDGAKHVE
jgi:hypothetical protein